MIGSRAKGMSKDGWHLHGASMEDLAWFLARFSPQIPVRDKTGLAGRYDFTLEEIDQPSTNEADRVNTYPINHLGLRLRPGKENRSTLVIDHIERPSPN